MRRLLPRPSIIVALSFACMCTRTDASLFYDFEVEDFSGTPGAVLATLELASLPASHNEVLGLTFTPEGQALFGFGSTYLGTFDSSQSQSLFVGDGAGGLTGSDNQAVISDSDPPPWAFEGGSVSGSFELYANVAFDEIWFIIEAPFDEQAAIGHWTFVVPEPSTLFLVCIGATALVSCQPGRRHQRKRQ